MVRAAMPRGVKASPPCAAPRLPPMRNTTGPHRARHSVFRHPASMPDKAGVEVYRYARRPVDSLVCICPIRGTGNASVRSCCALYGYVSGSHAVHSRCRKSGPSCALRSPRRRHWSTPYAWCSSLMRRTRSCRIGTRVPRLRFGIRGDAVGYVRICDHANMKHSAMERRKCRGMRLPPPIASLHLCGLVASASIPWRTKMPKSA
ncbi:hypothetical protein BLA50215_03204 [Burkholderia lata]|nr:hypothetical protein BLA50215_03204 [Burkholderia lata]